MWRILNNALPVKDNLLYKGINCDPFCSYCNTKIETINHIFMECDWARQAWFACPLTINMDNMKIKTVPDWIDYMLQQAQKKDIQTLSTIMYSIWLARNDREFNGKYLPPEEMVRRAMTNLHDYQANQNAKVAERPSESGKNRHNIGWSPPPNTFTKLNVDAHSMGDGRWGLGLVLRREDGSCVGAVTRIRQGSDCVLLAEALGLQAAMDLINHWNIQNTIIELDAKTIVDAVHSAKNPRTRWGSITAHCVKWLKENQSVSVVWTRRNGNKAAHALARWASVEPNMEWRSNLPFCIIPHIQNDMSNVISS
jgi:ribonuclease HI